VSILYDWAGSVIGQPLNPDGHYGNQCVDTIDHFGEFIFGVPWQTCVGGVTGARDLLDVAPDEYWERIDYYHGFVPQQFDVLVYGGDNLNQWGHTAVTWWADPNASTINVIQQDGFAYPWQFVDGNYYSAKPAHYYTLHYSQAGTGALKGVLRPRANKLIGGGGSVGPAGEVTETTPLEQDDFMTSMHDFLNTPAFTDGPTISEMFKETHAVHEAIFNNDGTNASILGGFSISGLDNHNAVKILEAVDALAAEVAALKAAK